MTEDQIFDWLKSALIRMNIKPEKGEITKDSRLIEDLGGDSYDAIELALAIEVEFNIEVDDRKLTNKALSLGDMVLLIKDEIGK